MAKIKPEIWAKAKALREAGKSLRQIEKLLNIPFMTISDRAKKEDWEAGKTVQLIKDTIRVESEIRTLEAVQQEVVRDEVDKQVKMLEFFNNSTLRNCSIMMKKVNADTDFYGHNSVQNTLHKGKETCFGKMPDVQVNNNNTNNNGALVMLDMGDME